MRNLFFTSLLAGCLLLGGCDSGVPSSETPPEEDTVFGSYHLQHIAPVSPPFGHIDARFLDGVLPEAVDYDIMSGQLWRHDVMERGTLVLKDDFTYAWQTTFKQYLPHEGEDAALEGSCDGERTGTYFVEDQTVTLFHLDAQGAHKTALVLRADTLTLDDLRAACVAMENGNVNQREYFLEAPVLVRP